MMKCKYPIITKNTGSEVPLPCGQCLPCRINHRRVWTHRMMLEQSTHSQSSFLTLTYDSDNLPKEFMDKTTGEVYADYSVNPEHHVLFVKRLRAAYPLKIRFFMCGEYGEQSGRPHYHYALFGYSSCCGEGSKTVNRTYIPCKCKNCQFIQGLWPYGHIYLGTLTQESAQYVCGYVTKKLTRNNTDYQNELLKGRHPEFVRSSRMPGLGYDAAILFGNKIKPYVSSDDDIPPYIVHDGRKWPIGRYLYGKIREAAGLPPRKEGEAIQAYKKGLLDLFNSKELTGEPLKYVRAGLPAAALRLINAQSALQMEKKHYHKLINKRGTNNV